MGALKRKQPAELKRAIDGQRLEKERALDLAMQAERSMQREKASMHCEAQVALQREEAAVRELRQVEAEMSSEELASSKAAYKEWCAANAGSTKPVTESKKVGRWAKCSVGCCAAKASQRKPLCSIWIV